MSPTDRRTAPAGLPAVAPAPSDAAESFAGLPPNLRLIAEVAGLDTAMKLAADFGGTEIQLPRRAIRDNWLSRSIGFEAAEKVCNHFRVTDADGHAVGRIRFYVPQGNTGVLARARRQLAEDLASGQLSARAAALRAGLSERTARSLRQKLIASTQGDLFSLPAPPKRGE